MRSQVLVPLAVLVVFVQACCCLSLIGGPQPPYSITPSDEAVQRFKERWDTVTKESLDNTFTITVTEEEMTSLATKALDQRQDLPPVSDLQLHFRDGRIEAYGTVAVNDSASLPGMVAFSVAAIDGKINVTLEEVAFGPVPVPDSALETATGVLNDLIAQSVMSELGHATITNIQVGEGEMTLSGTISADQP
jgi:hypothetical protein